MSKSARSAANELYQFAFTSDPPGGHKALPYEAQCDPAPHVAVGMGGFFLPPPKAAANLAGGPTARLFNQNLIVNATRKVRGSTGWNTSPLTAEPVGVSR